MRNFNRASLTAAQQAVVNMLHWLGLPTHKPSKHANADVEVDGPPESPGMPKGRYGRRHPNHQQAFCEAYAGNPLNFIPAGIAQQWQASSKDQKAWEAHGRRFLAEQHTRTGQWPCGYVP